MADINMEAQISVEFEEATSRQSLNSGETINTLWSKVKRWLSDLKTVCFSGSYNDLSDKPTSLPANGGNADTVGGLSASSFVQNFSDWNSGDVTDLALASKSGYVFINNGVTDMPFNNGYWFGNIHASSNHRHIVVSDIAGNKTYVRSYNASTGNWTEWKNISEIQNTCVTGSTTNVNVTLGFQPSAVIIVNSSGVVYLPSEITATGFKCKYLAEGTSRVYWAFR